MERLRAHLRRHNRKVALLSFLTLAGALLLWGVLCFVALWLFLLGNSVVKPLDWRPSPRPLLLAFAGAAALLCCVAWLLRRLRPNEAPRDHKGLWEIALDILLAVPRMTLAVAGTARARARLNEHELQLAWDLLRRMSDSAGPLPLHTLPLEIPGPAAREKILLALQLSELIDLRRRDSGPVLTFRNDAARQLAADRVRLR